MKKALPSWSEEDFVIKKELKILCRGDILQAKKLLERFTKTNYKKRKKSQKEFRVEKVIKRKGDKLCIKWKGYDSFLTVGLIRKT